MNTAKGPDSVKEQWLTALMDQYEKTIYRLCCAYLQDASLAQDAAQETFVKAYRHKEGFRGSSSEKTWLMRIAINTCKDMRRQSWFRFVDRSVTPEDLPEPASPMTTEQAELWQQVTALPRKYKEVVLLYYDQGMTMSEVAESLGIPRRTVSDRLKRAREALRMAMEEG